MHVAPHAQTFGSSPVAVETTSDDGRPMRSTGSAGSQADGTERAVALTIATVSAAPRLSTPAAAASTETTAPVEIAVPAAGAVPSIIAGATGNDAQSPSADRSGVTQFAAANAAPRAPTGGVGDVAQAQSTGTANDPPPASASVVPPPAAPETAMAAFYATRGDDMLAHKDVSAARKFYEFAANEGSARAAVALAKTYDPAFTDQLGVVGVRPDPKLAADWYRKATELGGKPAQLSQSDAGK
jgi:TPR repeat protein